MTGLVRDGERRFVDVDDETLTELQRQGGKVFVIDSHQTWVPGDLVHDGEGYVIELDAPIELDAKRVVRIKPRLVAAQGARP